jgi:hypothetical protein
VTCFHTEFQDLTVFDADVAPISDVLTAVMLVVLVVGNKHNGGLASSDTMFVRSFMKTHQLVRKLLGRRKGPTDMMVPYESMEGGLKGVMAIGSTDVDFSFW